jgi:hypothetical protein
MKTLTLKKFGALAVLCALATAVLPAADGFGVTFDLSTDLLRVTSYTDVPAGEAKPDVYVDSLDSSSFDDSELRFSYDGDTFGGAITLGFADDSAPSLEFDEVYGWIGLLGNKVKLTAGIFDNGDGINPYDDVIDDYDMGVFGFGSDFSGNDNGTPEGGSSVFLSNGILTDLHFGAHTLQLLFGPNIDPRDIPGTSGLEAGDPRFISNYGARFYTSLGFGTLALQYKLSQTPATLVNGTVFTYNEHTFGVYADITALSGLGLTVGYTGFIPAVDASGYDPSLLNGVDIRGVIKAGDRLSIHTHNNLSFAKGGSKDAFLPSTTMFKLYDAFYFAVDAGNGLSIIPKITNFFQQTKEDNAEGVTYDKVSAGVDVKKALNDRVSIKCGIDFALRSMSDLKSNGDVNGDTTETAMQFSVPVGVTISW